MRFLLRTNRAQWLTICLGIASVLACTVAQVTPTTQVVEVTQVVPVTHIVQSTQMVEVPVPIVQVTRVVTATRIVEVEAPPVVEEVTVVVEVPVTVEVSEKIVEVTRVVTATRIVEVEAPSTVEEVIVEVEVPVTIEVSEKIVEVTRVVTETVIVQVPAEETAEATPTALPIANDALLVWYDFEGDFLTSGIIADRSGSGHHAQVNGTVYVDNGLSSGQAIFFSGNGYIRAKSNPAAWRNTVTFSLWFKTRHPEDNYKLASAAWWSGGPGSGWILATHIPEFWSDDTQSLYLPGIFNNENYFPANEWVHEVVVYDGSRIKEYTNGQLVNDWPTTGEEIGQGQAMAVGAWPSFSAYNFQGSIDEFRLFSRALTPQEVQTIYNQR